MNFEKYFWRYIMVALLIIFVAFFIKWTECICRFTSSSIQFINNANEGFKNVEHFDFGKKLTDLTDSASSSLNAATKKAEDTAKDAKTKAEATASSAATKAQEAASDATAKAQEAANDATAKAQEAASDATAKAKTVTSDAMIKAQNAASKTEKQVKTTANNANKKVNAAKMQAQKEANIAQMQAQKAADIAQKKANAAKKKAENEEAIAKTETNKQFVLSQEEINNITAEENLFMESFNAKAHEAANEEARIRVQSELAHNKREDAVINLINIQREYNDAKKDGKPQHVLDNINKNLQKAKYEKENVNKHMNFTNKRLKNAEFNSIKFNNDGNILNIPNAMESFNTGETKLSSSFGSSLNLKPPNHPIQLNTLSSLDQDPENRRFDNDIGIESFECNIDSPNNVIAKYMNNINRVTDKLCNTSEYKLVQDKMTGGNDYLDSKKQNEYIGANSWIH